MKNLTADMKRAAEISRVGAFLTARQMALKDHALSRDGMTAISRDGRRWGWSDHFRVWACVEAR